MSVQSHPRDQAVQGMFDRIAGRYDLLNRVISFKLDNWWRNQAIDILIQGDSPRIVDLGTGTGDMIFSAMKSAHGNARVVGLDFSLNMLQLAQSKRATQPESATASPRQMPIHQTNRAMSILLAFCRDGVGAFDKR